MIEVLKAPPYATIQDLGFPQGRAWGLPSGGAMDRFLLRFANALVGNAPGNAAIEWALGPLTVRFERETRIAVLGAPEIRLGDTPVEPPQVLFSVPAGVPVSLVPPTLEMFTYLAVRGGIDVPVVMGSRSTYLPGGFGGHEGRRLQRGDRLPVGERADGRTAGGRDVIVSSRKANPSADVVLRVTRGPQWERFDAAARDAFFDARFTVSPVSDRAGYRLAGPAILPRETATLPSEAACPGAVQIPDGGQPIVLMPDGPTVGGYPKLAVVVQSDLRLLAQCLPGRGVRFREITLEQARHAWRAEALESRALEERST